MMDGFDKKISCLGIIGDGCGGGREFYVENDALYSYDPYTKENMILFEPVYKAKSISKHRCMLSIECEDETVNIDLSTLKI
ncbi:MAG: hypothetical protein ACI9TV_002148 [Sulfurimonas sp.]|jgi:hypothetical protein|uniref:thiamine biosynthesis protein ThiF n=1 Tax=Sulfurimonas sp. TaxID=2022749 RepID=UPI0039E30A42